MQGKYRKYSMLSMTHVKKFHVFNFCCLTEHKNFITIETFANCSIFIGKSASKPCFEFSKSTILFISFQWTCMIANMSLNYYSMYMWANVPT